MDGQSLKRPAPAKINIGLRLLKRREDGFHEIETIFHTLAWGDDLTLRPAEGISLEVRPAPDAPLPGSVSGIPADSNNLAWLAAERVVEAAGLPGVSVLLEKRIPPGAGLGGGSSDAAAVLKGTLELYGERYPEDRLREMALELGADVPFFLDGGCSLAGGVGEEITRLAPVTGVPVILILLPVAVSTPWAYGAAQYTLTREPKYRDYLNSCSDILELASRGDLENDLQEAVVEAHPEIAGNLAVLRASGAMYASMTGSGSAVYGLFETGSDAAGIARHFAAEDFITIETVLR